MRRNNKEYQYVRIIYILLIAMICIPPYLEGIGLLNGIVINGLKLFCLLFIILYECKLYNIHSLKIPRGIAYKVILFLYIISIFIIIRGDWNFSLKGLALFVSEAYVLPYILPIIILPMPNIKYIDLIINIYFKSAILVIPLWFLFANELIQENTWHGEYIGAYLPVFAAFLLGFPNKLSNKQRIYMFVIWAIYFILMMLNARRNMIFSMGYCAILAFYIHYLGGYNIKKSKKNAGILLLVILVFIGWNKSEDLLKENFTLLVERIYADTRSGVEAYFIADFSKAPIEDWIFGRGMHGGYYQELIYDNQDKLMTNRQVIETGYLNMLLKGGILYLFSIIFLMVLALVKSIKNRNHYSAFLRWLFLLYFIDLYATILIGTFCVKAIIFWFTISIALSKEYSYLEDINLLYKQSEKNHFSRFIN